MVSCQHQEKLWKLWKGFLGQRLLTGLHWEQGLAGSCLWGERGGLGSVGSVVQPGRVLSYQKLELGWAAGKFGPDGWCLTGSDMSTAEGRQAREQRCDTFTCHAGELSLWNILVPQGGIIMTHGVTMKSQYDIVTSKINNLCHKGRL